VKPEDMKTHGWKQNKTKQKDVYDSKEVELHY
jgi:hypothetical protein